MQKNIILLIGVLFLGAKCMAQETSRKTHWLTDSVFEVHTVLKTNKSIKQGPYKASFLKKTTIASGTYTNNEKTGAWNFYDETGKLQQTYNYDSKKFEFVFAADTTTYLHYAIDKKTNTGDKIAMPVKLGGTYYGYITYLRLFTVPEKLQGIVEENNQYIDVVVELLISPGGRLANYTVSLNIKERPIKVFNMNRNLPDPADQVFTPATVNGEPVTSRVFIKAYITGNYHLDFE